MRSVPTEELVRAWEMGAGRPNWFRGLILLGLASPEQPFMALARLTLGQRNRGVAAVRAALFGPMLTAICPCPRCGTVAEFTAGVRDLSPAPDAGSDPGASFGIEADEGRFICRPATSEDLAALDLPASAGLHHPGLVRRCLPTETGAPIGFLPPPALIEAALEGWYRHDPGVESDVQMDCDRCKAPWVFSFEWLSFTWTELTTAVRRGLEDVHSLAGAYGWRESDILAMSQARRAFYLGRIAS